MSDYTGCPDHTGCPDFRMSRSIARARGSTVDRHYEVIIGYLLGYNHTPLDLKFNYQSLMQD